MSSGERASTIAVRPWVYAACAAAALAGCAIHGSAAPPADVPAALQVPGGQSLTAALHATGVQIYECRALSKDPTHFHWVFQAPAAELADRSRKEVAHHYAGPTWEADDGSKVVGEMVAHVRGPDPHAVQWLLLKAVSNAGKGMFAGTQFIQRLHTIGGETPSTVCDSSRVGQRTRVPYSADYYFYSGRR